jgi:HEAT repeat protein
MKVDSGAPFAGNHGPNPTIETPNRYVRTAAALVIATNKAREGIPYLLELLKDSTCCVETISQRLLPTANGKSAPKNLVRNYPVRDTAAGALKQFGYSVRFVNGQYEATAPKP